MIFWFELCIFIFEVNELKSKKLIGILAVAAMTFSIMFSSLAKAADDPTDTGTGTLSGNPDIYVDVVVDPSYDEIGFGALDIAGNANPTDHGDGNSYLAFESKSDLADKYISFDEGATNSNLFQKVTFTGETFPTVGGLDNSNWLFLSSNPGTNTAYIQSQITGTLTLNGGGVTMPVGDGTEIGSFSKELVYYTTADAGATWSRNTKTIYIALSNTGKLYVDDTADLASAEFITLKGDDVSDAFQGNSMVLSTSFPTAVSDTVTFDFGYYTAWDSTQGNGDKTFYTLVDMPKHAATGHDWTWNLTITGEYHSDPSN